MPSNNIGYKNFVDNLQMGVFRCTAGTVPKLVYANTTFCQMFEYDLSQLTRLNVRDIFVDSRRFASFKKIIKEDGFVKDFEVCLKGKDRRSFWCSVSAIKLSNKSSKNIFLDVVVNDISIRKKFEKELVESKELFQTVFNNTAAAITVTDKDEKIVAWNPFAEQMLGMEQSDLFNRPVKDFYPPKEWKRMRSFRIRQKGMLSDIETKIYKKDGTILNVNVSISIIKDIDGNINGSIGIIRDITSQKIAEKNLRKSENKIRVILDNSAAAITLIDEQERIISWNKFTEHLFSMKKKDLYLRPVKTLYPDKEWKKIRAENIRKIGSKHHLETQVIDKKGNIIDVDLSINVLRDEGDKIIGAVGIMQDITKQKKFQEMLVQAKLSAEEANSAKSLFLANMSHEIRTPMNAIMGMIDLTLDTGLSKEQKENLLVAKDAADNLLGLLNDILDLSRVEAGKIVLESIEFHLPNVVTSVVKGLSVIARDKDLELEVNIDPKVPDLIEGDPIRIRQVLINLINNAIKFTHKGKIIIEVDVAQRKEKDSLILFSVIDEGIGIPEDKQDKVFEVFTQAEGSTTRRFGGTGLGLAICKKLVEMMGGRIWVESKESKGSKFSFTGAFKVLKQKDESTLTAEEAERNTEEQLRERLKDLHILLAEDNAVNQKIAMRMLEKQGWTVEAVGNGQEAVERVNNEQYDVVLMDAHMPILDGLEATRIIRKNEEHTGKHIPIIALTARAMQEDRQKCLESGMDGYVSKPIDRKKLFEEISNTLNKGR